MIVYICIKLGSLVFYGETREILILESKQWIIKSIKNIICNEVVCSDEYLTENKIISINTMHKRNKIDGIDKSINDLVKISTKYQQGIIDEIKEFNTKLSDGISKRIDRNEKDKVNLTENNIKSIEEYLLKYTSTSSKLKNNREKISILKKKKSTKYLVSNFYSVDGSTSIDERAFNASILLNINNKIKPNSKNPQILIYHTHASERYVDSSKESDTVVGVGDYLADLLKRKYGYNVLHIRNKYDVVNKKWNRNAYDTALPSIKKVLKKYPSIEVVIDLHRDSGKTKLVTTMGKIKVAKIMLFNGVSRSKIGPREQIPNHNLVYNLAFGLDVRLTALDMYPDFIYKTYIKGYRYNMHLAKKYMLIEVGNNKNTVMEAKSAMVPFAKILNKVLTTS